jgi:predicted  nucleic acid-binding Zn-ribbon protein
MPIDDGENPKLLQFIASTVEGIRDRLTVIEGRMAALEDRMGSVESRMGSLETRIGTLEGRADSIENRMEVGFTAVRGDLERVHLRLDSIEKVISARLDRVETEVQQASERGLSPGEG